MSDFTLTLAPGDTLVVKVPAPAPGQVIRSVTSTTTTAQIASWLADPLTDVIEWQTGRYAAQYVWRQQRTRPIVLRCKPSVVFDGTGLSGGPFRFGTLDGLPGAPTAPTTLITLDLTGSLIQNYLNIGGSGLIKTGWVEDFTVKGGTIRNCGGDPAKSHAVYIESDQVHRSKRITIADMDVLATRTTLSGVQIYTHDTPTGPDDVRILRGKWAGLNRFTYAYSDAVNVLYDGCVIDNVNVPIEAPASPPLNQVQGVVKGLTVTNSGPNRWSSPTLVAG